MENTNHPPVIDSPVSKIAEKVSVKMPVLIPQPHGGAILSGGVPGHVGGPGLPPRAFKDALRQLRSDPGFQDMLTRTAGDPEHPKWSDALRVVVEYDEERPGKSGVDKAVVRRKVKETLGVLREELGAEVYQRVGKRILDLWQRG